MPSALPVTHEPTPSRFVDDYLAALLAQASQLISTEFHHVVRKHGFSVSEWRVMASLADGQPINCWNEAPDLRPVCLMAVELARVAFEDSPAGEVLVEWRN